MLEALGILTNHPRMEQPGCKMVRIKVSFSVVIDLHSISRALATSDHVLDPSPAHGSCPRDGVDSVHQPTPDTVRSQLAHLYFSGDAEGTDRKSVV